MGIYVGVLFFLCMGLAYGEPLILDQVNVIDKVHEKHAFGEEVFSYDSVSSETLDKIGASSIDDILKTTTLASTNGGPRSSAEAPQIRGLNSQKLFLFIDGARQSFRTDHTASMAFDPSELKEVHIYKSPGSSLKGNSLGGGLVLRTKDVFDYLKSDEKLGAEVKTSYKEASLEKKNQLKVYGKGEKVGALISLSHGEASNLKLSNGETLPNSSYNDLSILSKVSYEKTKDEKISLSANIFKREDPTPLNPTLDPPEDDKDLNSKNLVKRTTFGLNYDKKDYSFNIYRTEQNLDKKRLSDNEKEKRLVRTDGGSFSGGFNNFHYELEVYKDYLEGKRGDKALETYPKGESFNSILSTHYDFLEFEKIKFYGGLRFNYYELSSNKKTLKKKKETNLTKKIGFLHHLTKKLSVGASYSEGYNPPKVQEVYADGLHHLSDGWMLADNFFIPNEKLKPEHSNMIEITSKYETNFGSFDLLTLKFQYFETRAKDYIYLEKIDRAIIDGIPGTTQFINIPNAFLYGEELSLEYMYKSFSSLLSYSKIRGKDQAHNLWISDLPADTVMLKLNYDPSQSLSFGYIGTYAENQKRINEDTSERIDATPSYLIHSLYGKTMLFNHVTFLTRLENATSQKYRKHGSHIEEVGLNTIFELSYKVNI